MTDDVALDNGFWFTAVPATIILQLAQLAQTPPSLAVWIAQCKAFGWSYTPSSSDTYGFDIALPEHLLLTVQPADDCLACAFLRCGLWTTYDRADYATDAEYVEQRRRYDRYYQQVRHSAIAILGPPDDLGKDRDPDRHCHALWNRQHSWLILQQCALDVQFGMEINFWLAPHGNEPFIPTSPLIDWLTRRAS
jgi:hypothetical protein